MTNQQAMHELKELLVKNFPDYIERVILFGSRARGKAHRYSDYDILIILKKAYDWRLEDEIYDKSWEIDYKYDILVDVKLISSKELKTLRGKQPFILDALEHGIVL